MNATNQDRSRWLGWVAVLSWLALLAFDLQLVARSLPREQSGDEWRYLYYANNLLKGFFSPRDRVFLWNGPGYPLLLAPFVKLGWSDGARYANAILHWGALGYAWLVLRPRLGQRWALAACAAFALYVPIYPFLPLLYSEVLCFFLVTAWIHHALRAETSRAHSLAAGGCLGALCLTKVVFGYALAAFLLLAGAWWLWRRQPSLGGYLRHTAIALFVCLPYLIYTYQLTGRVFYWSSAGANSFYWLTSPSPHEWGDWYHQGWVNDNPKLRPYHKELFDQLSGARDNPGLSSGEQLFNLCTPESGDVLMRRGVENIRRHPGKFARNWFANLSRLFVDLPQSVRDARFWNRYTPPHLFLIACSLVVMIQARRRRQPPPEAWLPVAGFGLLAFGFLTISSGMARFMVPLVPIWWLTTCAWFAVLRRPQAA